MRLKIDLYIVVFLPQNDAFMNFSYSSLSGGPYSKNVPIKKFMTVTDVVFHCKLDKLRYVLV